MKPETKPCVLIVDDSLESIEAVRGLLEDDYKIKAASSGEVALKAVKSGSQPDLILLDIMMPDMDGFEVCKKLKEDEDTKNIPVIFLTAKNRIEDEIQGFDLGAVDFISKPTSAPIVKARVRSQIELKQQRDILREAPEKLSHYLSPQIVRSIFDGTSDAEIKTTRKKLTVFFSDLCNFTVKSDTMEPEDLAIFINTYLDRMARIAIEMGGTLDKFIGDGIMIFFGDPESKGVKEDAVACVEMALKMQEAILELPAVYAAQGINMDIKARMGIHTGYCHVGNFGSNTKMEYTLLGRNVNVASRMETNGAPGKVHISMETYGLVRENFSCVARDRELVVKGITKPLHTYYVENRLSPSTADVAPVK